MNPPRRAVVVGYPYYARYLADLLGKHASRWQLEPYLGTRAGTLRALWAMRGASALISVGGPGPDAALVEAARACGAAIVVIWVGSDVVAAAEDLAERRLRDRSDYHDVADAPWLVEELRPLGIEARYLAVTAADAKDEPAPLPAGFRALTYLPEPRRIFYGEGRIYAIARAMPSTEFVVVGRGRPNPGAPRNVTFRGHVNDVRAEIDASTVLIRLSEHDGQSMIVLEAMARARHVVWNHALPGALLAWGSEQAHEVLERLRAAHVRHELELNAVGRAYVRRYFAPADVSRGIETYLDETLAQAGGTSLRQKPRAAITGELDAVGKVWRAWRESRR